jgi:hypothetical protein
MKGIIQQIGWGGAIGIAGGGLGMLVGGIAVFAAGPIAGLVYMVFIAGFVWVFWHFMFKGMVESNRLMSIGEDAEATILQIAENGSSMQMGGSIPKPGVTIDLEVRPKGKPAYTARVKTYISVFEISKYSTGAVLHVKFDPNDPQKVTVAE